MNRDTLIVVCVAGGVGLVLAIVALVCLVRCCRSRRRRGTDDGKALLDLEDGNGSGEENAALINALLFLRSHPQLEMDASLARIGSRPRKHAFLLRSKSAPTATKSADRMLLSLVPASSESPFCSAAGAALVPAAARILVQNCSGHPHVSCPTILESLAAGADGAVNVAVVRPWHKAGSLRDFIHQSTPKHPYSRKYTNTFVLNEKLIARFGRQILEGLLFLRQCGVPYYHLHAANVLVEPSNTCEISEIESGILGLAPYHVNIIRALAPKKVDPDVACFACVVFEMAMGFELDSVEAADLALTPTSTCPPKVKKLLESILRPWSATPPTIEDLIRNPFFAEVELPMVIPRKKLDIQQTDQRLLAQAQEVLAGIVDPELGRQQSAARIAKNKRMSMRKSLEPGAASAAAAAAASGATEFQSIQSLYYSTNVPRPNIVQPPKTIASGSAIAPAPVTAPSTSPTSTSHMRQASAAASTPQQKAPPPPSVPAPPPPPPPPMANKKAGGDAGTLQGGSSAAPLQESSGERKSLLNSICGFDASKLKKVKK